MADPSDPTIRNTIGKALGAVPSGVFVLSTAHVPTGPFPLAMLVSWVQQVGFDPPAVCLALDKDRPIRTALEGSRRFALSVLGQTDSGLLKRYARAIPIDVDPFDGIPTRLTPGGLPVLADAVAWLGCAVSAVHDGAGDHALFVATVGAGEVTKADPPFTHVRGNGFRY